MKNSLSYYYDINLKEINKIKDDYYFEFQGANYVVFEYFRDISEIEEIYELNNTLSRYFNTYTIIINKYSSYLFENNGEKYILMRLPEIENRVITLEDIEKMPYVNKKYKYIDKSNWALNWENKIDYIESYNKQIKIDIINESVDYFIGLWENAISYFENFETVKVISHIRIDNNMRMLDFLNPLNLIIDYRMRDLGEYVKIYVLNSNFSLNGIESMLKGKLFSREDVILLISRCLFPSYYFDLYEKIILDNKNNYIYDLEEIIKKRNNILSLLLFLLDSYSFYNINYIDWINN